MSLSPSNESPRPARQSLKDVVEQSSWKQDPVVGREARASHSLAKWVLILFGGVCALCFLFMFILFVRTDATFEKGADLVKFMIQSLLPLVTLAVGYYLGDRGRQPTGRR